MPEYNYAIEKIRSFVVGEMDMDHFVDLLNTSDEITRYLECVIEQIEKEHLPIKRRIICMKGVAQNKPFEVRSYAERYIKEYAQSFRDLSDKW